MSILNMNICPPRTLLICAQSCPTPRHLRGRHVRITPYHTEFVSSSVDSLAFFSFLLLLILNVLLIHHPSSTILRRFLPLRRLLQRLLDLPNGALQLNLQRGNVQRAGKGLHLLLREQGALAVVRLLGRRGVRRVQLVEDERRARAQQLLLEDPLDVVPAG